MFSASGPGATEKILQPVVQLQCFTAVTLGGSAGCVFSPLCIVQIFCCQVAQDDVSSLRDNRLAAIGLCRVAILFTGHVGGSQSTKVLIWPAITLTTPIVQNREGLAPDSPPDARLLSFRVEGSLRDLVQEKPAVPPPPLVRSCGQDFRRWEAGAVARSAIFILGRPPYEALTNHYKC